MDIEDDIKDRVIREKVAHDEDDVLKKSYHLKGVFSHTVSSCTMKRFEGEFSKYLEDVRGLKILDLGCGYGDLSVLLLKRGAEYVAGIDISEKYIDYANRRAKAEGFEDNRVLFRVMDAHELTFDEGAFDLVVGSGVLHHLNIEVSLGEVNRVLKVGGRALFKEPLAANPLLKLFRFLTPNARTIDERPLTKDDLALIANHWDVRSSYYGIISSPVAMLTSIVLRPYPDNYLLRVSDYLERNLNRIPALWPYNQYVLLNLIKNEDRCD